MKKNISINISGIIFNIEEDGYDRLKIYLDEIKRYFATYDDTGEIAADIENRVAEIFLSRLNPQKQVITAKDVDSLITQMGNVQDFEAIEEPVETEESSRPYTHAHTGYKRAETGGAETEDTFSGSSGPDNNTTTRRRLYRDGKRKVMGGVAAGVAHYFRIDAFWIRLLFLIILLDLFISFSFSSVLLIGYIVCWVILPERYDLSEDKKIKKMFRNPDDKVIGGVASGLAAYFGVDPTLIRVVFLITIFLGGSGLIAYLILWIITPEASTLTDRMQMQGEPLTLSNIEHNIKKNLNVREGEENMLLKVLLFPFRLISAIFSGAGNILSPLLKFLGDLIRIIAGIALIIMGFGFLLSLITATTLAIGGFPETYIDLFEMDVPSAIIQNTLPPLLLGSGFITLFIPGLMIILLGIAIIARRWLLNKAVSWFLFALWIISLIVFAVSIPAFAIDLKTKDSYETEDTFTLDANKTAVLELTKESKLDFNEVDLTLKATEEAPIRLEKRFWARGRNEAAARELAQQTIYQVRQKGDTLLFSQNIELPENTPYRGQEMEATLYIPIGQQFVMDNSMRKILPYTLFQYGYTRDDISSKNIFVFNESSELVCLNCPEKSKEEYTNNETQTGDASGEFTRKIEARDFSNISAGSNYQVIISQSADYSIRLEGEKDAVNSLEFEQEGNTIHFRNSFSFFDKNNKKVNIYITLPELQELDLNGAAEAKLKGWKAPRIELDLSGASEAEIEGEIEELEVDLSGSSKVRLRGSGSQLNADLSGSSELNALEYTINKARLDLSGASYAGVNAKDQLEIEASGVSQVKYKGNPSTTLDKSSSSRVEKQQD